MTWDDIADEWDEPQSPPVAAAPPSAPVAPRSAAVAPQSGDSDRPFTWPDHVPTFPKLERLETPVLATAVAPIVAAPAPKAPRPTPSDDAELTVHRKSGASAQPVLSLRDGTQISIGDAVLLVGRRPSAEEDGVAVVVSSDAVSRTHFAVGRKDDAVWIQDRNSTNGTRITNEAGQTVDLTPGRRTLVPLPVTVEFGDERARITG